MHGDMPLKLVDECSPALTDLGRVGATDAMHQFCHRDRRQGDFHLTEELLHILKKLLHALALALGFDDDAGIED
jgi:hypothetical protein